MSTHAAMQLASDAELADAVTRAGVAGSPVAEAELCRRFGRRVRLYGRRRLRDDSAVDDLVQRVMLVVLSKLREGAVREPDRIDSFVLGTARLVTREMSRPLRESAEIDEEMPCPLAETRPDLLEVQRLAECLKALAERERTVVSLSFFEEQSAAEVGDAERGIQALYGIQVLEIAHHPLPFGSPTATRVRCLEGCARRAGVRYGAP